MTGMAKTNNQWNSNKYSVSETSVAEDEVFMVSMCTSN
jgi:hypothetical protein